MVRVGPSPVGAVVRNSLNRIQPRQKAMPITPVVRKQALALTVPAVRKALIRAAVAVLPIPTAVQSTEAVPRPIPARSTEMLTINVVSPVIITVPVGLKVVGAFRATAAMVPAPTVVGANAAGTVGVLAPTVVGADAAAEVTMKLIPKAKAAVAAVPEAERSTVRPVGAIGAVVPDRVAQADTVV